MLKIIKIICFIIIILFTQTQYANELLIYADDINYDSQENIVAKGNVKIISGTKILTSEIMIYNKTNKKISLPLDFYFKDENGVYYYGSSAEFSDNLKNAEINDVKLLFNDGSRIVGKSAIKKNEIDIITKGSYSPCESKIKFKDFKCPIWQLDGEKILHNNDNLFLYQKHSKIRLFNLPVFYLPYFASPSPLRKDRKSGFLIPTLSFNFINTKVEQSVSLPYYFNIDIDKELTFTPIFNYGGGVDSSQRLLGDYNQIISGGNLSFNASIDTTLENKNNEKWFQDASLITKYEKNINEKFKIDIDSAFQTSISYMQKTDPNNDLAYNTALSTTLNLHGYNLRNFDDKFLLNISSYQVAEYNVDNANTPTVLPFISYQTGINKKEKFNYENEYTYYYIFRDKGTSEHSEMQQRLTMKNILEKEIISFNSKINFKSELHNQYFQTQGKSVNDIKYNTNYYKFFPMSGIFIETPFKHKSKEIFITPKISLIANSSQSNSEKISNEISSNNTFSIENNYNLNRYSGTDKLDNSKRINFGLDLSIKKLKFEFSQLYELSNNSNYHSEMGNNDKLSDILSRLSYSNKNNGQITYNIRYDTDISRLKNQSFAYSENNKFGDFDVSYLDERKETNNILTDGNESLLYKFTSSKFKKYSRIFIDGSYNLIDDQHNEYGLGYSYFDECFGISINFERLFYEEADIEPTDKLTIMFSFKNLGSYKSSNLAVSETDKQDIEWEFGEEENEFY